MKLKRPSCILRTLRTTQRTVLSLCGVVGFGFFQALACEADIAYVEGSLTNEGDVPVGGRCMVIDDCQADLECVDSICRVYGWYPGMEDDTSESSATDAFTSTATGDVETSASSSVDTTQSSQSDSMSKTRTHECSTGSSTSTHTSDDSSQVSDTDTTQTDSSKTATSSTEDTTSSTSSTSSTTTTSTTSSTTSDVPKICIASPSVPQQFHLENPYAKSQSEIVAAGQSLYQSKGCAGCHGASGEGVAIFPALNSGSAAAREDCYNLWIVSVGNGSMPAFQTSTSQDEIWRMITFIRSLQ